MHHVWAENGSSATPKIAHLPPPPHPPKIFFFSSTPSKWFFINLLVLFILQNFKTILIVNPKLWGCTIFMPKVAHFHRTKDFFGKVISLFRIIRIVTIQKMAYLLDKISFRRSLVLIFLRNWKTLFRSLFYHLDHFFSIDIFPNNSDSATHIPIWVPNTKCKVS